MIALRLQNPSDVAQKVGWPQVRGMVGWGRQVTLPRALAPAAGAGAAQHGACWAAPALQAPSALLVVARHSALLACGQEAPAGQAWCLAEASGEFSGRLQSRTCRPALHLQNPDRHLGSCRNRATRPRLAPRATSSGAARRLWNFSQLLRTPK